MSKKVDSINLIKAARSGDPEASYKVGIALLKGTLGMKRKPEKAVEFLKKSAEANKIEAIDRYADILRDTGQRKAAAKYYRLAIAMGSIHSMVAYGKLLNDNSSNSNNNNSRNNGNNDDDSFQLEDEKMCIKYFKMASDLNNPEATYLYGVYHYQQGQKHKAKELFQKAVQLGDIDSIHMLSVLVEIDDEQDDKDILFEKKKEKEALENDFQKKKRKQERDEIEQKIDEANSGDAESMLWLFEKYKKNRFKSKRIEALKYLEMLSKSGDIPSMKYLALCYRNGRDVDVDMNKYAHYLKMAADEGDVDSMLRLAELYQSGVLNRNDNQIDVNNDNNNNADNNDIEGNDNNKKLSVNEYKTLAAKYYSKASDTTAKDLIKLTKETGDTKELFDFSQQLMLGDVYPKNKDRGTALLKICADKGNQDALVIVLRILLKSRKSPALFNYLTSANVNKKDDENNKNEGNQDDNDKEERDILKYLKSLKDDSFDYDLTNQFLNKTIRFDPKGVVVDYLSSKIIAKNDTQLMMNFYEFYRTINDLPESVKYLKMAINSGNEEAKLKLKKIYEMDCYDDEDKEKYLKIGENSEVQRLKERADSELGDTGFAMVNYALALLNGKLNDNTIIEPNIEEGILYLKKAAEEVGTILAMQRLGDIFENGEYKIGKNEDEAIKYFQMGAEKNDKICSLNYTKLLLKRKEGDKAKQIIDRNADPNKNNSSSDFVDALFVKMKYEWKIDPNQMVEMLKAAADVGETNCMKILSSYLRSGRGIPKNIEEANKYSEMFKRFVSAK